MHRVAYYKSCGTWIVTLAWKIQELFESLKKALKTSLFCTAPRIRRSDFYK